MNYNDYLNGIYKHEESYKQTATQMKQRADLQERTARAHYKHMLDKERKEEEAKSPQVAMDKFLAGIPYEDVLAVVKQHYPEKFI